MKSNVIVLFSLLALAVGYVARSTGNTATEKRTVQTGSQTDAPQSPAANEFSGNWYAAIRQDIVAREYFITYDAEKNVFQSPNRSQDIRSYYAPGELKLENRRDSLHRNWHAAIKTIGIYADGRLIAVPQAQAASAHDGNSIEYRHAGFTEQYINSADGVRQNFIVEKAPSGTGILKVSLRLDGFTAKPLSQTAAVFSNGDRRLTYSGLKVWDARKNILPARMEIRGQELALVVDAEDAIYPVTIDPIVASGNPGNANTTVESNQASAGMGFSVSGAGDVNGDGYSDVIVGAHQYDNGQNDEGAAFVYHGSSNGIGTAAALILEANQAGALFGTGVSNAGDVNGDGYDDVIVGARQYDNGQTDEGAAFVYMGSAAGLTGTPAATLEGNAASANFGRSVSGAGDVNSDGYSDLVVGAHTYANGETDEGRIFVFHGAAGGAVTTAAAAIENNQAGAAFGFSVSGAGDVNGDGYGDVVVGAYLYDNGQADEGAASVYHGSSGGVSSTAAVTIESNQASANMGTSVSGAGDVNGDGYGDIVVGAYLYDNGQADEGATFVYHGASGGIGATAVSTLESNQAGAGFGYGVSGAGDVNGDGYSDIVSGAYSYDNGQADEGAACVFHGAGSGVSTVQTLLVESNQAGAQMGFSVASAGDINGDGYSDVLIGAWFYDNGQTDEGAAFVYMGSATGVSSIAAVMLECNQASAGFGYCVASAGDINGDGYSDVLVSAYLYDNGQTDEGIVHVYHGSSAGLGASPAVVLECNQASALMGNSVASAGDINGDGYSDVVVGAFQYDNGQADEGVVYVYHGSSAGIGATATSMLESNQAGAKLGRSSGAGDVNGDGYDDIIAGAQYYDNGETDEGVAFVYHGSAAGINTTYARMLEVNSAGAWFARNLFPVGDVNGDGFSDIIVGAQYYDNGETDEGGAFVYHGSASGIGSSPATSLESNQTTSLFGYSVCGAGDVNGDGYSDVIVGAYQYDNGQTNEGAVFIYHGSVSGVSSTASAFLENNMASAGFGICVATAGDVNGDGFSDVLVGATTYANGQTGEGAWYVFQGNAGGGLRRNLRLYNTGTTVPITQSNILSAQFAAGLYAKNPEGRTKGKLVWEVKREGQAFTSASTITKSTQFTAKQTGYGNLGTAGMQLTNNIVKPGFQTKVRARIQYDPATSQNGQVYSQWIYPPLYFGTQGMNATPLPVTLVAFVAAADEQNDVLLQWQTEGELNNDHFVIDRSADGYSWEKVTVVDGHGNTSGLMTYGAVDPEPYSGISYYRLQQVDFDGNFTYSEIVAVEIDGHPGGRLVVYPNPAVREITVEAAGAELESYRLYNCLGEEISAQTAVTERTATSLKIDVSLLPAGVYTVKTLNEVARFVKQ